MNKKLVCTALAAFLFLGSGISVQAEDYMGGDWKVEFTGKEMVSNFSSSDISGAVYALQPGDSVTINLDLENTSGGSSDWYMTSKVLASLEDSSDQARGGAYVYRLVYTGGDKTETVLFDSMAIGGEKNGEAELGLHEAVKGMDEYFRLDTLSSGAKGRVTLVVALDGETQGNAYQNTLADLQMSFAVDTLNVTADDKNNNDGDKDDDGNGGNNGSGGNGNGGAGGNDGNGAGNGAGPGSDAYSYSVGGVRTGDDSNLALWSGVAFASGLLLLVMALFGLKKRRKEEES